MEANGFLIEVFANDVLEYMNQENIQQANVFSYSMGGYVAMFLAKHHLEKVEKLIKVATKFHWDNETAAKETETLDVYK